MDVAAVAVDLQSESHFIPHLDEDGICTSPLGSIPDFDICDDHMSMQGVRVDLQSDDEVFVRSDEDGQCTNTIGCPIQGELFINSTSHVPEPHGQADMNNDDGQPSMHIIQSDLRTDSAIGLYLNNNGLHECADDKGLQISPEPTLEGCVDMEDEWTDFTVDGYDDATHQSKEIPNIDPANECDNSTHSGIVEHAPSMTLKRIVPTTKNREQPATKRTRPVVFATHQSVHKVKLKPVNPISRAQTYTMQDLFSESMTQVTNVMPFINSFLKDPQGYQFIESTIQSDHDAWLAVARYVAMCMHEGSISSDLVRSALSLMSIKLWFNDIANECCEALKHPAPHFELSPLVCAEFIYDRTTLTSLLPGTLRAGGTF
ncbi:hypothetical protein CY34DRAFT_16909 [Suillus luteus UH-Slu-Lm8-n1]|uniref:Uncharacterized protein n=1 Tax=Suillus luteus UH-Slu-Lm8-n1 TaxID=930992 RepID=A0A0D0A1I9_9AGAM|nr:hypothetical protein CY34DRAFT_16909 [Suillus luteus UH-Slu-Lm8-n1]